MRASHSLRQRRAAIALGAAALLLAGACDRIPDFRGSDRGAQEEDEDLGSPAGTGAEPEEGRSQAAARVEVPDRIYYSLTDYEWFRQRRPLPHEGRSYQPAGRPLPLALGELEEEGSYDDVDFYSRRGAPRPPDTLYVPVFEGYWLPFAPSSGRDTAAP